jgi:hypothetical protein
MAQGYRQTALEVGLVARQRAPNDRLTLAAGVGRDVNDPEPRPHAAVADGARDASTGLEPDGGAARGANGVSSTPRRTCALAGAADIAATTPTNATVSGSPLGWVQRCILPPSGHVGVPALLPRNGAAMLPIRRVLPLVARSAP